MQPTNLQENMRYFSQQDRMRIASSKYSIPSILGSKIGYTNIARYSYVCLAEQDGVRLICVTMRSEAKTDKYTDVRTLLNYAFETFTGYSTIASQGQTAQMNVVGGGEVIGQVTVTDPGVSLLLAQGVTEDDVTVALEVPERWVLGTESEAYAVYTVDGHGAQENISVRVPATVTGLADLLATLEDTALPAAADVEPQGEQGYSKTRLLMIAVLMAVFALINIGKVHRADRRRAAQRRRRSRH
jgi:D-alanyl-D-alanine carboxypeptidase (penicillin-binding protein 5/6)